MTGRNSGGLFDRKELADENFMLVAVEIVMKEFAKFSPSAAWDGGLDGMNPTLGWTIKMLVGHSSPHGRLNTIHSKIVFS